MRRSAVFAEYALQYADKERNMHAGYGDHMRKAAIMSLVRILPRNKKALKASITGSASTAITLSPKSR